MDTEKRKSYKKQTLILGLGNTILSDDGVGIYVAREIGHRIQDPGIVIEEASIGGLELLERIKGYDCAVLIDAVQTGQYPPGSLIELKPEDLPSQSAMTRHHVGLTEAVALGKKVGMSLPNEILIYGIEVKEARTFGESCTPELESRISDIADAIVQKLLK